MAKMKQQIDGKTQKVISIIAEASSEITDAAQDALELIEKIQGGVDELNEQLETEKMSKDEALGIYAEKIGPMSARLSNRFKKMTKNTKAIQGLLNAAKAMADEEEKAKG